MRRVLGLALLFLLIATVAYAQDGEYSRRSTYSGFVSYANNSSHIYIGQERNRKVAQLGFGYSRRFVHKHAFDFNYEFELRPVTFIRDPVVTGVSTVNILSGAGVIADLPYSGPFSGPTTSNCATGTTTKTGVTQNGIAYSQTTTQVCGERWTYAGGFSPLGLRFNFAKSHRVQPFLVGNGGLLVSPHDEPVNFSNRLNFTFEVGAGLEFFSSHQHSWALDYRVHHLSNANSGYYNPGIDSQLVRASYRFGR